MEKGQGKGTDTLQTDNVFTRNDYIEREAAVMKIREWFWSAPGVHPKLDRDMAEEIMFAVPAADVVPVVRCKNCRYAYDSVGGWCCSHGICVDCIVREDFFCADGARMDGDGE